MKKTTLFLAMSFVFLTTAAAQDSPFSQMEIITTLQRPTVIRREQPSAEIKNIQTLDDRWGIAYTASSIFATSDGGGTWRSLGLNVASSETISTVAFADRLNGFAIVSDLGGSTVALFRTADGGNSWQRRVIDLGGIAFHEARTDSSELDIATPDSLSLKFRVTTSSNFEGSVSYISHDAGLTWQFVGKSVELRRSDEPADLRSGSWTIKTDGACAGFKTGCVQETRLFANGTDITPPQIVELTRIAKENARTEAVPMFAAPPGGSTRISLNRGFDKCTAASVSQMQAWWDYSYFRDANIYMSGRNRACSQAQLTANWVNQVTAMGWGLIPTIVGYQSPCTASATTAKFSYDVATAEQQGRGEADIAVTDATALGLTTGSVLYYDMERYNENDSACRVATSAFLKGWTDRVHELGYISGVYGSPFNADPDWVNLPLASRMDAIWMARWDNRMSVWSYLTPANFTTTVWNNHQRIKQWQAPHDETWGGVTFNIDGNIADGPVAGLAIPRNRTADFDGDGRTDLGVFRPDNGVWYIHKSNGTGYIIVPFGIGTDIPTPGDYDGDGKTDQAVFRPSDGTWHMLAKAGFYTARTFGQNGDIPAPGDFNGDGKTDIAIFRPSTGVWYIANSDSMGTFTIGQFGLDGDKPVVGDYDGDGKADIAVWRPSTGIWYVLRSSDANVIAVAFGIATDRPAQGDYDGDGKTDFVVLRDGTWYQLRSTAGFNQFDFGLAGDLPITGDYDGDGKDDAGVYRPSDGVWYVLRSQNGFFAAQFGVAGDKPVPNSYLPQ